MKITKKNIIIGILVIILLWGASAILIHFTISDRGTFGDMFGAINALFSGLALFGIIISILIQQNELNLQRKELKDTRKEFVTSRVTNILFKQLEYLNTSIDRKRFQPAAGLTFATPFSIEDFVSGLQDFREKGKLQVVIELINKNSTVIASISSKIVSVLNNIDEFLKSTELDDKEVIQMKKLFKSNINPAVIPLLGDRISILKSELKIKDESEGSEIDEIVSQLEKSIAKIELENIRRILTFDQTD